MRTLGFSWHVKKPRSVRIGQAYADGLNVFVLKSPTMSDKIAVTATKAFAKTCAVAYNVDRAIKR